MTRQVILHPSITNRRQPLLSSQSPGGSLRFTGNRSQGGSRRFAEVAGGTAAECAAVCCCCPCGIMNFLVLAVYKVPAGLCKKALKNKKMKRMMKKKGVLTQRRKCKCGYDETEIHIHSVCVDEDDDEFWPGSNYNEEDKSEYLTSNLVQEMESEMWDKFYSNGFWRNPSQKDSD